MVSSLELCRVQVSPPIPPGTLAQGRPWQVVHKQVGISKGLSSCSSSASSFVGVMSWSPMPGVSQCALDTCEFDSSTSVPSTLLTLTPDVQACKQFPSRSLIPQMTPPRENDPAKLHTNFFKTSLHTRCASSMMCTVGKAALHPKEKYYLHPGTSAAGRIDSALVDDKLVETNLQTTSAVEHDLLNAPYHHDLMFF